MKPNDKHLVEIIVEVIRQDRRRRMINTGWIVSGIIVYLLAMIGFCTVMKWLLGW